MRGKSSVIVDSLVLLLNILSGGLSIIPILLMFDNIPINSAIVCIINIIWIVANYKKPVGRTSMVAFIPFFIMLVYQLPLGRFVFALCTLVGQSTFLWILSILTRKYSASKSFDVMTNIYIIYCLLNVIGVCLAYSLIEFGVLNPYSNTLDINILTKDEGDVTPFFPGYLSVLRPNDAVRVAFLTNYGLFCGYSHEPHVVAYICMPGLFLIVNKLADSRKYNKPIFFALLFLLYVLFLLLTMSATSFICTIVSFMVFLLFMFRNTHKIKYILLFITIVVIVVISTAFILDNFAFVFDKLIANEGSKSYSQDRLSYAISPHNIFGSSIYTSSIDGDIGFFPALFNLAFYISFAVLIVRLLRIKHSSLTFSVGMALFYMICHSMKIILLVYRYQYVVFFIFLGYFVCKNYHQITQEKYLKS